MSEEIEVLQSCIFDGHKCPVMERIILVKKLGSMEKNPVQDESGLGEMFGGLIDNVTSRPESQLNMVSQFCLPCMLYRIFGDGIE